MLTSAVSGALDRLQGETDPCCKYDTSKKTWQYLHLGRTSEDFGNLSFSKKIFNKFIFWSKYLVFGKRATFFLDRLAIN